MVSEGLDLDIGIDYLLAMIQFIKSRLFSVSRICYVAMDLWDPIRKERIAIKEPYSGQEFLIGVP